MPSDKSMETETALQRILRERLEPFNVPSEIRSNIAQEIMALMQRPEKKLSGATCMTLEASVAADLARKSGQAQKDGPTPKRV